MRAYMSKKNINLYHTLTTSIDILIYDMSRGEEVRAPWTTLKYAQALSSTYVIYYNIQIMKNHAFMLIGKCISYSIIIVVINISTTILYYFFVYICLYAIYYLFVKYIIYLMS